MPKYYAVNKSSITAAKNDYKLSYHELARRCGMTLEQFNGVMNHKSNFVQKRTYDNLCKVFKFNSFGYVQSVPYMDEQIEQRKQRKEQLHEHIRQQEKRRLLKIFISNFFYILGACGIIAFGLSEFWG